MWKQIIAVTVFLVLISLSIAASQTQKEDDKDKFLCYACSYTVNQQSYGFSCVNETSTLVDHVVKCGNFCITSEHWDKRTRQLDSVFRSCSNNLGNVCREDETAVTCLTSCKGDLCNNVTLGGPHEVNERCNSYVCHNDTKSMHGPNIFGQLYFLVLIFIFMTKHSQDNIIV